MKMYELMRMSELNLSIIPQRLIFEMFNCCAEPTDIVAIEQTANNQYTVNIFGDDPLERFDSTVYITIDGNIAVCEIHNKDKMCDDSRFTFNLTDMSHTSEYI